MRGNDSQKSNFMVICGGLFGLSAIGASRLLDGWSVYGMTEFAAAFAFAG